MFDRLNSGNRQKAMEEQRNDRERSTLDNGVPLSRSLLWKRQREFYVQRGLDAWAADRVPQFITNNPLIAEIYARIVFEFIRDYLAPAGEGQEQSPRESMRNPVRILELGAGTGKFAFLFLRNLVPLLRDQGIPAETLRYIMTDCSQRVVESWRHNRFLKEFVQAGLLEFKVFAAGQDPEEEAEDEDADASPILGPSSSPGPLVVIANYVFDSLPADAFSFRDGRMEELLITTAAPDQLANGDTQQLPSSKLQLSFRSQSVSRERYLNPVWNGILEHYRQQFRNATVLFPSGALDALGKLLGDDSKNRPMLLLAADKGYAFPDTLACSPGPPAFEWHAAECFSLMANFDAIARYFEATGGAALLPDKHSSNLHICGFLSGGGGQPFQRTQFQRDKLQRNQFPRTQAAYRDAQAGFGPDDLFTLLAWLNAHMEETNVPQILATLRLTRWDPIALMRLFPVLGRQLRSVQGERHDIRSAILRIWGNHFPVSPEEDLLAFNCGVVLLELRYFEEAAELFRISQQAVGPSAATTYNLGLCALGLNKPMDALALMKEACGLDPAFAPARQTREKLEMEFGARD